MISVIIPLYNKEKQIKKTLETVLSQTFQDFEIVIVNDGSTDNSVNEVSEVKDNRIRLINQENAGVSAARNKGIKEAKGEYVAFLDADDEWKTDYLQCQYQLTQLFPQCDVFATNYEFNNQKGKTSATIINKIAFKGMNGVLDNYFVVASYSHPPLWTSAVMVQKSAIQTIGGFPLGIKSGEDLLTWAKLAARYKIAYHREAKAIFNVEGYDMNEKPKRVPASTDVVGEELIKLYKEKKIEGLRKYISHWYKMRSSIYMRLDMRKESIVEACKAITYRPGNYKLYAYIILNLLPSKWRPF